MADSGPTELDQLRRENARLIASLETHGIDWYSAGDSPSPEVIRRSQHGRRGMGQPGGAAMVRGG